MSNEQEFGLRVKSVHVKKLFGMYDHDIVLKSEERTTIIFGRNGAGKTVIFRLIHALLGGGLATVADLFRFAYEEFRVVFNNEDQVIVKRKEEKEDANLRLIYLEGGGKQLGDCELSTQFITEIASSLVERSRRFHPIGQYRWVSSETGETLDAFQVVDRWGLLSNDDIFPSQYSKWKQLLKIRKAPDIYFIQYQRLLKLVKNSTPKMTGEEASYTIRNTVSEYSVDLKKQIDKTQSEYGRESQRLEQTYPQRFLGNLGSSNQKILSSDEIQNGLETIEGQLESYQRLGIIDDLSPVPKIDSLAEKKLDNTYIKAMSIYVQDTETKLEILDKLARRLQLFLDLIDYKFKNKKLEVDQKSHDLKIRTKFEDRQNLNLSDLSSGEQHQLVLTYELLFHTSANTLVLIDEPELSLHVEWQERFRSDLKSIIDLVHFDALLATHSPYIVNGHNDLLVGLSVKVE